MCKAGAVVNHCNEKLLKAASEGNTEYVNALITAGADVNHCCEYYPGPVLNFTAEYDHTECVKALLAAGADVNIKNSDGRDALYYSALNTNFDLIQILLNSGANVNSRDRAGKFPLLAAVNLGYSSFDYEPEKSKRVKCVNI